MLLTLSNMSMPGLQVWVCVCVCLLEAEWWPLSVPFIRNQSSVLSHLSLFCSPLSLSLWRTDPYQIIIDGRAIWAMNQSWSRPHSGAETNHIWQGPHWVTAGHMPTHTNTYTQTNAYTLGQRILRFFVQVKSISRCLGCSHVVSSLTRSSHRSRLISTLSTVGCVILLTEALLLPWLDTCCVVLSRGCHVWRMWQRTR